MSVKVVYSNSYEAKRKRIQSLPKLIGEAVSGKVKRNLLEINKIFHDGIKFNKLSLEALKQSTIISKKSKGYEKPRSPLYGAGDKEGDRAYSGMMKITKIKNGWKLQPSRKKHHSKKLYLKDLLKIHEYGAVIKRRTKDGVTLIKIPPRPAFLLSYNRWLRSRRKDQRETSKELKKAVSDFINTGKSRYLEILSDFDKRSL